MSIVLDGTSGLTTNSGTLISASTIGVGGATPSTSGAGISFPATQSASTDGNTLDDYEEGSWTPSLGGTATYSVQSGTYVKIGRFVYIQGQISVTLIGTGSATRISGLPFTVSSASGDGVAVINYFGNLAANVITPTIGINASTTVMDIFSRTTAGTASSSPGIMGNTAFITFTGHYIV